MTPEKRFNKIVEHGLCLGCGLCQTIAGAENIRMELTDFGLSPTVDGHLDDATVDKIYATCPGTHVEGLPENLVSDNTRDDKIWGPWLEITSAYASNAETRFRASTGGALTALATYLLNSGRVDFILHTKASSVEPTCGEAQLSFNEADVIEASGSRYGTSTTLLSIDDVLERNQTFAFIGKPCDVAALRNYASFDERVNQQVKFWLAPVCGGFMPVSSTYDALQSHSISRESVTAVRYRGFGCPGPTRIKHDNNVTELHYLDFWGEDESQWQLPFRCKICPDGIGEAADIAAADTWPGGSPSRETCNDDGGTNALIVRSETGLELLQCALRDNALVSGQEMSIDDLSCFQPHQVNKKKLSWPRMQGMQGMQEETEIILHTSRLRIKQLAKELSDTEFDAQRLGTRERIRRVAKQRLTRGF